MKERLVLACSLLCLIHTSFAIKPVQGTYGGVFLGPTYAPDIAFTFNPSNIPSATINSFITSLENAIGTTIPVTDLNALLNVNIPGKLTYSVLGGFAIQIGRRFCDNYRVEIEGFYNNNPFNELKFTLPNGYTVKINSSTSNPNFHIGGDTNTGSGLFNFIYDFLIPSHDGYSTIAPYAGVGVGYAYVQNSLQFHYGTNTQAQATGAAPATLYEADFTQAHSTYAGQAILGISYFMDDFCWLSLDARYFATGTTTTTIPASGVQFQNKTQLYSVMLGFNGILDFG